MGAGVGYNIPISVSLAESHSLPQNTEAGTNFYFGSVSGPSGITNSQEANPINPATATSSAAEGNAASIPTQTTSGQQQSGDGFSSQPASNVLGSLSNLELGLIGGAVLAGSFIVYRLIK